MNRAKPFCIAKREVWEAYKQVKANRGAAGVDGQSIEDFEQDLSNNLYRIWNRMSSGSYFPPPVRRVDIPKGDSGKTRPLGIPAVSDESPKRWSSDTWNRSWSRSFIKTPTDIGQEDQPTTLSPWLDSGAGAGIGCSISISRVSSIRSIGDF